MDFKQARQVSGDTLLTGVKNFDLAQILDCGQCFRWEMLEQNCWHGVALDTYCKITADKDTLLFHNTTLEQFNNIWYNYFDFERDYDQIKLLLSTDKTMGQAVQFSLGMRVLRQPPWETLCSFILSQNNNIKRIKGIVQRTCELFGEEISGGYTFPTAKRLAGLSVEDLAPLRSGFRAKYILSAANLVASDTDPLELPPIYALPIETAMEQLMRIQGVGPKVACCALLYGFHRVECVPIDVWIKRALETFYPDGLPQNILPVAGIAQQYLFHYIRHMEKIE